MLEHCLHDVLARDYKAKIISAKTGLGYSNVTFKGSAGLKNVENIFKKINKDTFSKHKKLVLSEIWQKERNFFFLTSFMEYGCDSISDLNKIKKDFYKVSFEEFVSFCKESFSLELIKNLNDVEKIETENTPVNFAPKTQTLQKQLNDMTIVEHGWFIPVKNIAEAEVLSWFYFAFLKSLNKEMYEKGISYRVTGILHKPAGLQFFVNVSIVADKVTPIKLTPELGPKEFEKKRKDFIKDLEKNKIFNLEDAFCQKMDWGNYMTDEELISYIQKTPYSKWSNLFSEKSVKGKTKEVFSLP